MLVLAFHVVNQGVSPWSPPGKTPKCSQEKPLGTAQVCPKSKTKETGRNPKGNPNKTVLWKANGCTGRLGPGGRSGVGTTLKQHYRAMDMTNPTGGH